MPLSDGQVAIRGDALLDFIVLFKHSDISVGLDLLKLREFFDEIPSALLLLYWILATGFLCEFCFILFTGIISGPVSTASSRAHGGLDGFLPLIVVRNVLLEQLQHDIIVIGR